MKTIVMISNSALAPSRGPPQGVSSPDLPDGRKVIGPLSQTDQTEPEVEPAVSREAAQRDARALLSLLVGSHLDDRFHETGVDEASIHGTGIMFVDSSFEQS
jgi:hypothetical protein